MMSGLVGQGAKVKAAELVTTRILWTADGFRVTVEHRRGFTPPALLAAPDAATARVRAEVAANDEHSAA